MRKLNFPKPQLNPKPQKAKFPTRDATPPPPHPKGLATPTWCAQGKVSGKDRSGKSFVSTVYLISALRKQVDIDLIITLTETVSFLAKHLDSLKTQFRI